jgi:LacI family transcriptional regulator
MTTISDIAKAANVSKATVSRFLNKSGYVSERAADVIQKQIELLNYVPSAAARNLTTKKSKSIGVVIPEVSNPFFAEVFKGISKVADEQGFSVFYCDTDNDAERELRALEMLRKYEVEGIIFTPATGGLINHELSTAFIQAVQNLNAPIVLLDRDVPYMDWDGVFIDNFQGANEAVNCLIDAGHRNIGIMTGDRDLIIGKEREQGALQALKDHGLVQDYVFEGNFSAERGYDLMSQIMNHRPRITALFSPNNLSTLGILNYVTEHHISIPEDLALVGFDDISLLGSLNIPLTVMARDTEKMGCEAMNLLLEKIDSKNSSGRIVQKTRLIRRGTEQKI